MALKFYYSHTSLFHINIILHFVSLSTKCTYLSKNLWNNVAHQPRQSRTQKYHKYTKIHWRGALKGTVGPCWRYALY